MRILVSASSLREFLGDQRIFQSVSRDTLVLSGDLSAKGARSRELVRVSEFSLRKPKKPVGESREEKSGSIYEGYATTNVVVSESDFQGGLVIVAYKYTRINARAHLHTHTSTTHMCAYALVHARNKSTHTRTMR